VRLVHWERGGGRHNLRVVKLLDAGDYSVGWGLFVLILWFNLVVKVHVRNHFKI
jgi:hypothetical protein